MKKFSLILSVLFLIISCSSSNSIVVQTEMLDQSQTSNSVEEVTIFKGKDEIDGSFDKIANFKVNLFEEDDPEQKIIEAFQEKAKEIGANGILITKNESSVQAKRNMEKGGITTGINRDMEAVAILVQ